MNSALIKWNSLVAPLEHNDISFPSKSELEELNWGNSFWEFSDVGFRPLKKISKSNSLFVDYGKEVSTEKMYLKDKGSRAWLFRNVLHQQIIKEYTNLPESDEKGLLCIFTHGPIASGKTSFIDTIVKKMPYLEGAIRIDYDRIKTKLPEYEYLKSIPKFRKRSSEFCQSESSKIAGKLFKIVIRQKRNHVIFEGSQSVWDSFIERLNRVRISNNKDTGRIYIVMVVSTIVPLSLCIERAEKRYQKIGRYVPPEEI